VRTYPTVPRAEAAGSLSYAGGESAGCHRTADLAELIMTEHCVDCDPVAWGCSMTTAFKIVMRCGRGAQCKTHSFPPRFVAKRSPVPGPHVGRPVSWVGCRGPMEASARLHLEFGAPDFCMRRQLVMHNRMSCSDIQERTQKPGHCVGA
jgi:hypothetical protein